MALSSLILLAVLGLTQAQTSTICARIGGVCSYNKCSRYYLPSGSGSLCGTTSQKCCFAEKCLTQYRGNCQYRTESCTGGSVYPHNAVTNLCSRSVDICCIKSQPGQATTTPSPVTAPAKKVADKCGNYGGTCINQGTHQCDNGQLKLIGSSNEILCNDWLTKNERCCMGLNQPAKILPKDPTSVLGKTTVAPKQKENCDNYRGTCANQVKYRCNGGEFQLLGSKNEMLCSAWSSNNERCCMAARNPTTSSPPAVTSKKPFVNNGAATCGVQTHKSYFKRIVGGNAAEKGEWPWQASIIKSTSYGRFSHTCGGTLIAPQWVVSAAHCFRGVTSSYYMRVRVGEHSFYVDEGTENNAVISRIIVHPQYIHSQNKNDIALIKLSKPVDITGKYTRTACLPTSSDLSEFYKTSECYTTGWGKTQGTGGDKSILQEVKSSLVSQSSCYRKWGYKIDSTKVCFGNGYKGACQGDSGGPLVCKKDGRFNLVGVVSYGTKSCVDRYVPTVYTSVTAYRTWIDQTMAKY